MNVRDAKALRAASLETPTDLGANAVRDIFGTLNILLADMFALYVKTNNFHWHMSGRHFRDYHLLRDEHATQIFATTDDIAERVRKIGGTSLHSIGQISRSQRILRRGLCHARWICWPNSATTTNN
jgi:starvation-inducible DNA-binding protein